MRYITIPNITFLIKIQAILTTIASLQIMDVVFQYTNGGPAGYSNTIALNIYKLYNEQFDYGQGSAAAIILLMIIASITMLQMNAENKQSI